MIPGSEFDAMMLKPWSGAHFFLRGPFGQWFRRRIVFNHIRYNCNEQWMMAEKARLFNDRETLERIMEAQDPSEQKGLGRMVNGFDQAVWDAHARDIVYRGNLLKMQQHPDIKQKLLETQGLLLVEANPRDTIWGIGLGEFNPDIEDRSKWRGKNWLGQVLTKLREDIIAGAVA